MTVHLLPRPIELDDLTPASAVPAAPALTLAPVSDFDEQPERNYPLADALTAEDMARVSNSDYAHLRRAAVRYCHGASEYVAANRDDAVRLPAAGDLAHDAVLCLAARLRDAYAVWTPVETRAGTDDDEWLDERPDHGVLPINRARLRAWALEDAARFHGCDLDSLLGDVDGVIDRPRRTDLHLVR